QARVEGIGGAVVWVKVVGAPRKEVLGEIVDGRPPGRHTEIFFRAVKEREGREKKSGVAYFRRHGEGKSGPLVGDKFQFEGGKGRNIGGCIVDSRIVGLGVGAAIGNREEGVT